MTKYLLDTNILVWLELISLPPEVKVTVNLSHDSQNLLNSFLSDKSREVFVSFITVAEVHSLVYMKRTKANGGGFIYDKVRRERMFQLLNFFPVIPLITPFNVLDKYIKLDLFTAGIQIDNQGEPVMLPNATNRLAKNDLWIAAIASATNAVLVTADTDFRNVEDSNLLNLIILD